ncbi:transmembrane channel 5 isoform X1 [Podarcis lilfordi]|uniref:Transmembrane channel-like protein n=1 Tax=Podarcis lilfordi TaxID=74358 RepID=A0AA35PNA7_9SAUR|nr:transmembrane channel 5 isoform X1 [Podarcis lilfordi]
MSFHYNNEAFENPDYHHSETLEIDRTRPSQRSTSFRFNPYGASPYESDVDYDNAEERGRSSFVLMPMSSMQTPSDDDEYRRTDFVPEMSSANPYGNSHVNPSFEYEPELIQRSPAANNLLNDPYAHRLGDMPDGVHLIQRRHRQEVDMVFMTPSSLFRSDPGYEETKKKDEEKLIGDLADMSTSERIKAIQKIPKPMKEKREIRDSVLMEKTRKSHRQINCCSQCFYNTALETLSDVNTEYLKLSQRQKINRLFIHLAAWVVSLLATAGSCAGIYYFCLINLNLLLDESKNELQREAATLVLPIVVSLLNHGVPFFYSSFGFVEKFASPRNQIYTAIVRNVILKISIVGILCYYWLNEVPASKAECWETLVGQDIYRLLVAEFICCLLGSFFGEFLRRIVGTKCCKKLGVPEFDIARNVLDLIYAQTLTWIGVFYSPLLPAIQMISYFIIFWVKKVSLMRNCQPPRKAWRASQMNTLFVFLLFFPSFTGVLSVIAVTVWRLEPSKTCGPFRGLVTVFESVSSWMGILASYPSSRWVVWIYRNLIESVHFFFILSIIVLIITYLYWQIIDGRKIMVKLLQEQIINEGKDKMFLLKKLRALQASKLQNQGEQPQRSSSVRQSTGQQVPAPLPNSTESSPATEERDSYFELARPQMTSFSRVHESSHPAKNTTASEALALALRARQEAEWEMGDDESS